MIFKFFIFLVLSAMASLLSFMGLAFSAAGTTDPKASQAMLKCVSIYSQTADILLNIHLLVMPVYLLVTLGLFFWKSHEAGMLMAKASFILPVISFLSIGLFFFITSRIGE